jgi:hypothetical protein
MKRVAVWIDRLVLNGFRHDDAHAIAAGFTHEFTRLVAGPSVTSALAAMGDVPYLRAGSVPIGCGASPRQIGAAAARQIGKGIPS